jgi:hypothetical protein
VSNGVDDRDLDPVILAFFECGHIVGRLVLFESNDIILADRDRFPSRYDRMICVQFAGAVLRVDDTNFIPVPTYPKSEKERGESFSGSRGTGEPES